MKETGADLMLKHLRLILADLVLLRDGQAELVGRVAAAERHLASLMQEVAEIRTIRDRHGERLHRIERRLDSIGEKPR